jgi:hypothetical protein
LVKRTKIGKNIQNDQQISQMAAKYTKCTQNLPNDHTTYQHLSLQDHPKFTQIGIFGLKIFHLANPG